MISLKRDLKKIMNTIKAKNCALVLVSTGVGITSTGCVITIEVPDDFLKNFSISSDTNGNYNIKYEDDTYAVITDETKLTTDSSITDIVETSTTVLLESTDKVEPTTEPTNQTTQQTTESSITTSSTTTEPTKQTTETEPTNPPMPETQTTTLTSTYSCIYGYGEYKVKKGDTLYKISNMTGMSVEELKQLNTMSNDNVIEGEYIAAPALLVLYNINEDYTVDEISYQTGISKEEICRLNTAQEDFTFSKGYSIMVKELFGGEIMYDTTKGKANVVNNTIIFGEKIIKQDNKVLALQNNKYNLWCNDVILYTFDNENNYTTKALFSNAKYIDLVNDTLVAYIRTSEDIERLKKNAEIYEFTYENEYFETKNNQNYPIYMDSNSDILYTIDGEQHDFDEFNYDAGYFQYRKEFYN